MSWKLWTRERLTSADVQAYLQDQTVLQFPSVSARDALLTAAQRKVGMVCTLADSPGYLWACIDPTNNVWVRVGERNGTTAWPKGPQGELGRGEYASRSGVAITATSLPAFTVGPITLPAGRRVELALSGHAACSDTASAFLFALQDNGVTVRQSAFVADLADVGKPLIVAPRVISPAAGAHTFGVVASRVVGGGGCTLIGDGLDGPVQFTVRDLGAV